MYQVDSICKKKWLQLKIYIFRIKMNIIFMWNSSIRSIFIFNNTILKFKFKFSYFILIIF